MKRKGKGKAFGMICAYSAIYMGLQFTLSFSITLLIMIKEIFTIIRQRIEPDINKIIQNAVAVTPVILIVSIALALLCYYFIIRERRQSFKRVLSMAPLPVWQGAVLLFMGLSANLLIGTLLDWVSTLPEFVPIFEQYNQSMFTLMGGGFWMSLLTLGILAPIFEEVLFRGLIYSELRSVGPVWAAVLIQGVIFGLYHLNIIQSSYAMVLGLLLGLVLIRCRSLLAPILLHISFNSTSSLISLPSVSAFCARHELMITLMAVAVFCLTLLIFLRRKKPASVQVLPAA